MSESTETTAPFIDKAARVRTTLGALGALVAITAAGVAAWVWAMADIRAHETRIKGHDTHLGAIDHRVRTLEAAQTDIAVMKNDVQWIRRTLEQQRRGGDE